MARNDRKSGKETRWRRAARRLQLAQKRVAHAGGAAGWVWNVATGAVSLAGEWRDILVAPADRPWGRTLEDLFSRMRRADAAIVREQCGEIAAGRGDSLDIAVRMRRFDNTWAWILLRGRVDGGGAAQGLFFGIGIEVSRLRLDKRFFPPSVTDSPTSYHSILEHSPHHIIRFDRELFPLYTNPAVNAFISCPVGELGAKKAAEVGSRSEDLDFIQSHVDRVYASGEVIKIRRSVATGNGDIVGDFTFWPEFDESGAVRSVISMQQDLTAEVKREEEAHANEMRFSSLYRLSQMNDAPEEEFLRFAVETIAELTGSRHSHLHILPSILEPRGHIVWSASHLPLLSKEELAEPDPRLIRGEFGITPPLASEPAAPIFQNGPAVGGSDSFFKGRLPITRYLCAPALEDGRPMCVAAVYNKDSDYTEADMRQLQMFINGAWLVLRGRRYVAELGQAKESAELANKVKDRFLANVSHELRTPLNGMLSMLQLLEMTPLSQDQAEYARSATTTGQTLLRIISDILDYSKMEAGRYELEAAPFSFKGSLVSTVGLFTADAKKKGLKLHLSTTGDFHSMVLGDEARVRQILFNLIGNALKFTEQGEIEVFCEARPKSGNMIEVRLSVRDTGIGIPVEMQNKVFEAFTQVDGSSTRRHQGSGLGLGIVRLLTQAMGGSVVLKSVPGAGTLVECVIPFQFVPGKYAGERAVPEPAMMPCPSLDVLVAEDDAVSRRAMHLFLEKLGHRAVCVTNGREALEALRLYPFACLISDVLMPEMDGLEVTRRIRDGLADQVLPSVAVCDMVAAVIPAEEILKKPRRIPREVPIVAVSAHAMKGDREHFLAQGMDYYLSKPTKLKELAAVLLRVHERRPGGSAAVRAGTLSTGD